MLGFNSQLEISFLFSRKQVSMARKIVYRYLSKASAQAPGRR
jgi:hypothetical protein